jgi:hypothetical protein
MVNRASIAAGTTALATAIIIALPSFSSGATVKSKLRSFAPVTARQAQAPDPTTQPPLHGANPHGQGTAAVIDLNPSATRPFSADPTGSTDQEDIVVGRSRGEQRADGTYHGHITVAALFGNEIIGGADTAPGQSVHTAIAQNLLDQLCVSTSICLSAVRVDSATSAAGSVNRFSAASASLGGTAAVPPSLSVGAVTSNGNIANDATCQASHGDSQVANVSAGGQVVASVATSASDARACQGQAPTQTNTSSVVNLGAAGLPIPAPGCANGTPDTLTGIPALLPIVCNADDSSAAGGTQAGAPYGVRDALDVYVAAVGQTALAKVSTSSSESFAVAPPAGANAPGANAPGANNNNANNANNAANNNAANNGAGANDNGANNNGANNNGAGNGNGNGNGNGGPQCSDGVDNDGDGVIDSADPGCHTDGNANNPSSFNPNDDSEANGGPANLSSQSGNQLPFTGVDAVALGLAGALLLAAGLALRAPTRRRREELS